jgi:Zn-dependent M16 (insulinase) family peptidase
MKDLLDKMSEDEKYKIIEDARILKELQEKPDSPESIASIPVLKLSDMEKENKVFPCVEMEENGTRVMCHDLFTNGIVYFDLGFDLHMLPQKYIPYAKLFGRALTEMGTEKEDYTSLNRRISRKTGGIRPVFHTSMRKNSMESNAYMFLRGKAMLSNTGELLDILKDILLKVKFDNKVRFKQIVLEAKAKEEQKLMSSGHHIAGSLLKANFNEADWVAEQMNGLSYLFFLRELVEIIETDWGNVLSDLGKIRDMLVNRTRMILNVTIDDNRMRKIYSDTINFINDIPSAEATKSEWLNGKRPDYEGIIVPSQVNYVAKGTDIKSQGYQHHGSIHVITRFLRSSRLWEQVRVKGGAYGVYCNFDRLSGMMTFSSYRDPDILNTISAFDGTGDYLRTINIEGSELTKAIIGTIGKMDSYLLPDAKGYISMLRQLSGETDEERQKIRDEILNTGKDDLKVFAEYLDIVKNKGIVKIVGSEADLLDATKNSSEKFEIIKTI